MSSIPIALQIAVAAVGIIGTGGTVTLAILSHRTASRALKLSEDNLRFAHDERTAALRATLVNKRMELYGAFIENAIKQRLTISSLTGVHREVVRVKAQQSGEERKASIERLQGQAAELSKQYLETYGNLIRCLPALYAFGSEESYVEAHAVMNAYQGADDLNNKALKSLFTVDYSEEIEQVKEVMQDRLDTFCETTRRDIGVKELSRQIQKITKFEEAGNPFESKFLEMLEETPKS